MKRLAALVLPLALLLAACGGSDDDAASETTTTTEATTTTAAAEVLEILVTNDDGIAADGIDAVVEALRKEPDVEVVVVAPAENQSGQGENVTEGTLVAKPATTKSGYEGTAVEGRPADTVIYAIDTLKLTPDVIVSGTNIGQNIGPFAGISGTVGATKRGVRYGIPGLAVSTGITGEGAPADHEAAAELAVEWVREHREAILAGDEPAAVTSINVPTCPDGPRGLVEVELGTDFAGRNAFAFDCESTKPEAELADDIDAFLNGYASMTAVPVD